MNTYEGNPRTPRFPKKTIAIGDVFTDAELKKAFEIIDEHDGTNGLNAMLIEAVVGPALPRINKATGQENDAAYFGYVLQHAWGLKNRGAKP